MSFDPTAAETQNRPLPQQHRPRFGELLVQAGVLTPEQLREGLKAQKRQKKKLGQLLIESGFISEEQLAAVLSAQLGLHMVHLDHQEIPAEVVAVIPRQVCVDYEVFPVVVAATDTGAMALYLAMSNPADERALQRAELYTRGHACLPVVATRSAIGRAIARYQHVYEQTQAATAPQPAPSPVVQPPPAQLDPSALSPVEPEPMQLDASALSPVEPEPAPMQLDASALSPVEPEPAPMQLDASALSPVEPAADTGSSASFDFSAPYLGSDDDDYSAPRSSTPPGYREPEAPVDLSVAQPAPAPSLSVAGGAPDDDPFAGLSAEPELDPVPVVAGTLSTAEEAPMPAVPEAAPMPAVSGMAMLELPEADDAPLELGAPSLEGAMAPEQGPPDLFGGIELPTGDAAAAPPLSLDPAPAPLPAVEPPPALTVEPIVPAAASAPDDDEPELLDDADLMELDDDDVLPLDDEPEAAPTSGLPAIAPPPEPFPTPPASGPPQFAALPTMELRRTLIDAMRQGKVTLADLEAVGAEPDDG